MARRVSSPTAKRGIYGVVAALALALIWSCSTAPPDTTPASVTIASGDAQTATVGTAVGTAPSVTVKNAGGDALSGVSVTFAVASGGGSVTGGSATTDAQGVATAGSWTLGTTAGANTLTATVQGVSTPATFTATGTAGSPTTMTIVLGNHQTGGISTNLPIDPRVRIEDGLGNPVEGVDVTFTPRSGSGSVSSTMVSTDVNGQARTKWAPGQGGTNLMDVTTGPFIQTFFSIGSNSAYKLEVVFLTPASTTQMIAFGDAAARWMDIITGDLGDIDFGVGQGANACGVGDPNITGVQDDLIVFVSLVLIDGPGGILGSAGPCFIRTLTDTPLTVVGVMQFDTADLPNLEAAGTLGDVILHEMAHVIGYGTLWNFSPLNLLNNPSLPSSVGADTHFSGANAVAAFNALPGGPWVPPSPASSVVPVENTQGGQGTRDTHWRESTFVTELMTGFIAGAGNPLSTVTIQSLLDMGYAVDINQADAYPLGDPNGLRAGGSSTVFHLKDDILRIPLKLIDRNGRVVGVVDP